MPEVLFLSQGNWYVPDTEGRKSISQLMPRAHIANLMIEHTPGLIAGAFRAADLSSTIKATDVVVASVPFGRAINAADIWIKISATYRDTLSVSEQKALELIAADMSKLLLERTLYPMVFSPAIDISLGFGRGFGCRIDPNGQIIDRWP